MIDRFKSVPLDDRRFDRLVDGELSAGEYKALLAALDEEPELWRRCAMAFLEAQSWRSEMFAIRRGREDATAANPTTARPTPRRWLPILAIAASFAIAFFGGLLAQRQVDRWNGGEQITGGLANVPGDMELPDDQHLRQLPMDAQQEPQALGNIRLVVDGGQGQQQQIDVPVYDLEEVGVQFLAQEEPALDAELVEQLERRGRKVERHVEYLPLTLDEKHQVVVPVEQYQITPVSRRSY